MSIERNGNASLQRLTGCILTPGGWIRGLIEFASRIWSIDGVSVEHPEAHDQIILPGFIDLHVHGGGGSDVMEGAAAIEMIAATHARHGTTGFLATTVTAEKPELRAALTAVGTVMKQRKAGCASILGVHLEGPYINSAKLGAQPDACRKADIEEVKFLHSLAPIRVMTIAPELVGHLEFIKQLNELGIITQCGHSAGTYEEGVAALSAGIKGFTHLFNAMSPFQHRAPGMVGAALAHASYSEIIPDLLHVHPGAILAAVRAIPHLYCVTDSTAAAGMPDGKYKLGSHVVTKCMGGVRLADGTLAGSSLTMDQALRNLVRIGLDLSDASRRLSTFPADYLGITDRGRLAHSAFADLVVLTPALNLKKVFVEGEEIEVVNA